MILIKLLLKIFPAGWRTRYEEEFLAVLEQSGIHPIDYVNILMAAVDARLNPKLYRESTDYKEEAAAMIQRYRLQVMGARWTARVLGFLASGFFLLFLIGEGLPALIHGNFSSELLPFLPLLGLALAGYVYAWFNEGVGGLMLILGGLFMASYLLFQGGMKDLLAALIYCVPFLVPGILFLISRSRNKKMLQA